MKFLLSSALLLLLSPCMSAADHFVSKHGNDGNNGAARDTAFATIQKGVNMLQPGDTLTIGPGEYFESVKRTDLGSEDKDTIIRAEIPGQPGNPQDK